MLLRPVRPSLVLLQDFGEFLLELSVWYRQSIRSDYISSPDSARPMRLTGTTRRQSMSFPCRS